MAITLAWHQIFSSFENHMQVEKNLLSHSVTFLPLYFIYSGWMLSTPGAWPTLSCLMANSVSHTVKSQDKLESHPWALHSLWTLAIVALVKCSAAQMCEVDGFHSLCPSFPAFIIETSEEVVCCIIPHFIGICIFVDV